MSCNRRAIKVEIFDQDFNLLGQGTNGPLVGDCECPGACVPAGQGGPSTECFGAHAEMVAVLSVPDADRDKMYRLYSTKAPCLFCVNFLLGTPIQVIEFEVSSNEIENEARWRAHERDWLHVLEAA